MLKSWKLKEIVLMSLFGVVFGIVYLLFIHLGNIWAGLIGPIAYEWMFGIWFIVSIICMHIIRKPGAALIPETMAAIIEVMLGNAVGPRLILSGIVQGLGAEAAFAVTRYRHFNIFVFMLAGIGAAVFSFIYGYFIWLCSTGSFIRRVDVYAACTERSNHCRHRRQIYRGCAACDRFTSRLRHCPDTAA